MPELSLPNVAVRESFVAAMEEFAAEGRGGPDDRSRIGHDLQDRRDDWATEAGFTAYVDSLHADRIEEAPRPEGFVPATELWYVEGDEFLGRLGLRHRLNDFLINQGGHIGYDVRLSARRRGYATAMLRAALPMANDLGIDPALVTCDLDNVGSRTVIETCGGVQEDIRGNKRRFWVPTS